MGLPIRIHEVDWAVPKHDYQGMFHALTICNATLMSLRSGTTRVSETGGDQMANTAAGFFGKQFTYASLAGQEK